jgi:hypothetical protein
MPIAGTEYNNFKDIAYKPQSIEAQIMATNARRQNCGISQ